MSLSSWFANPVLLTLSRLAQPPCGLPVSWAAWPLGSLAWPLGCREVLPPDSHVLEEVLHALHQDDAVERGVLAHHAAGAVPAHHKLQVEER